MKNYKWSRMTEKIDNDNKVLIAQKDTGLWIVISKNNYEIVDICVKGETFSEYYDSINDKEKEYFCNLVECLTEMKALVLQKDINEHNITIVTLEITNSCNLQCKHCCQNAELSKGKLDVSYDSLKAYVDKILILQPETIALTGGEPLLRPDFEKLVEYIREKYSKKLILMTNGTLVTKAKSQFISQHFDSVEISLDGVDEETCSKVRGKGVYDHVIKAIKLLQKAGMNKITISMVETKDNIKFEDSFFALNRKLGTKGILRPLSISGRVNENPQIIPDSFNTIKIPSKIIIREDEKKVAKKELAYRRCPAGDRSIYLSHKGFMYPCGAFVEQNYLLGNINDWNTDVNLFENMIYISRGYKNLKKLLPEEDSKCKKCNVSKFCYNCISSYCKDSSCRNFSEFCDTRKEALQELVWGN